MGGAGGAGGPQRGAEKDPVLEDERGAGAPLEGAGGERRTEQQQYQVNKRYRSFSEVFILADHTATYITYCVSHSLHNSQ